MARSIAQRGHHVTCALIGMSRKLAAYNYTSSLALWTTLEYELVHTNWGLQKVRVEPATRSAVATCNNNNNNNIHKHVPVALRYSTRKPTLLNCLRNLISFLYSHTHCYLPFERKYVHVLGIVLSDKQQRNTPRSNATKIVSFITVNHINQRFMV